MLIAKRYVKKSITLFFFETSVIIKNETQKLNKLKIATKYLLIE